MTTPPDGVGGPGAPPPPPPYPPQYPPSPPREGRPVSFYVALFLFLLLLVSGGLNVLLVAVSAMSSVTGGFGATSEDGQYRLVSVSGEPSAEATVLRVPIEGTILEGSSPLLGASGGTVSEVRRALKAAAKDDSIRGVLFDINSPGGGVTDSDEIYLLIRDFKSSHPNVPVIAMLGDMAASGGYYIASPCDAIIARPTSITGSIGVILNTYNVSEALDKIGVKVNAIVSKDTPFKDMLSPFKPISDVEMAKARAIVQELYERFVQVVAAGRTNLSVEQVHALATGEIYSAKKALELGLIDAIGTEDDAEQRIADRIHVEKLRVVEYRRVPSLLETLMGARQQKLEPAAIWGALAGPLGPRFLYLWNGGR